MPARVVLEVVSGPIGGTSFAFDRHDIFLFGRHGDCHARLPKDGLVSRHHFLLEVNPPDACVRDLGSLNGTHINGRKIGGRAKGESPQDAAGRRYPTVDLRDGDQITVGQNTIQVRVELPKRCGQCSAEIPEAGLPDAEWITGSWLCRVCRAQMQTLVHSPTAVEKPLCNRCGKDVAAELANGRRGVYTCQACRQELDSPGQELPLLVQHAARRKDAPDAPDIAGYDFDRELGRGGMGVVYAAKRRADGMSVAIKLMLANVAVEESAREQFLREMGVTSTLRHPNLVSVLESGSVENVFYFVMDHCNGGDLSRLMARQGGRVKLEMAAPIMLQSLAGLAYAHERRLIHRDLKPQNILLHESGGRFVARISDFGLAKNFSMAGLSGMTATGDYRGTYRYMPREQLTDFKYLQPASDVWSMAATFYKLLTGEYPLSFPPNREPVEVILEDEPRPIRERNPTLPVHLADCLDRALLTDPTKRHPSAVEMLAEMQQALASGGQAAV